MKWLFFIILCIILSLLVFIICNLYKIPFKYILMLNIILGTLTGAIVFNLL